MLYNVRIGPGAVGIAQYVNSPQLITVIPSRPTNCHLIGPIRDFTSVRGCQNLILFFAVSAFPAIDTSAFESGVHVISSLPLQRIWN